MRGANPDISVNAEDEEMKMREQKLKKKEEELRKKEGQLKKKEAEQKRRQELFIKAARKELSKVQDKEHGDLQTQLIDSVITTREFRKQEAKLHQKHDAHMRKLEDELRWRFANEEGFDPYLAVASNQGK